jgi:hypothetical protein
MTDTKTTEPTTEMPAQPTERQATDRPAERLSTADIAGQQPEQTAGHRDADADANANANARPDAARTHKSEMPEATVAPLFAEDATNELRGRWDDIQTGFVDEPRTSVEQADALVAEVMKRLADSFATERQALETQWARGDDAASTEDLRVALRRYRSFFDRLLSI